MQKDIFHALISRMVYLNGGAAPAEASGEECRPEQECETAPKRTDVPVAPSERKDTPGTVKDYVDFLLKDGKTEMEQAAKLLREQGNQPPYPTYVMEWSADPRKGADFIDRYFPKGQGRKELINGLRVDLASPRTTESDKKDYELALVGMIQILEVLNKMNERYYNERQLREKAMHQEGTVPTSVKDGVLTLVENFKKGDAFDKGLTIVACAAVVKIALMLWKRKIPGTTEMTYGKLFSWGIGAWALNEISGKVSKDGKTALQRLGFGSRTDQLRTGMWGLFAVDAKDAKGRLESPVEVETMLKFGPMDMKPILEIYKRQEVHAKQEFSESQLIQMGFDPTEAGQMDKKAAFKCVDKLVRRAGKNYAYFSRHGVLKERNYSPRETTQTAQIDFEKPEWGIQAIEARYTEGVMASMKHTFEEVMTTEMADAGIVDTGADPRNWVTFDVDGYTKTKMDNFDQTKLNYQAKAKLGVAAGAVGEAVKTGYDATRDFLADKWTRSTTWLTEKWDKYYPQAYKAVGLERRELNGYQRDLTGELTGINVEVPEKDKVMLDGVPFNMSTTTDGGRTTYNIEGVRITVPASKTVDNTKGKIELQKKAKERAKTLIKKAGASIKKDVDLHYDNGSWHLDHQNVKGKTSLGIPSDKDITIDVHIDSDSKVTFEYNDASGNLLAKTEKYNELSKTYVKGYLNNLLFTKYPSFKGLNIKYNYKDIDNGNLGVKIPGILEETIGFAVNSLPVFTNKLDNIPLTEKFIEAKIAQVAKSDEFHKPFEDMFALIADADESTLSHLKAAWDRRVLWVVPNVEAAFSGKIVQARFRYLLDYKKAETLYEFKKQMEVTGKTIGDLDKIEKDVVDKATTEMATLQASAYSTGDIAKSPDAYMSKIEEINYGNQDYKDEFEKFRKEILLNPKFNFSALPGNSEAFDESHIIYTKLLTTWYYYTRELNVSGGTMTTNDRNRMTALRSGISTKLSNAQQNGPIPAVISENELPPDPKDWTEITNALSRYPRP